jgi:hypothetical protein
MVNGSNCHLGRVIDGFGPGVNASRDVVWVMRPHRPAITRATVQFAGLRATVTVIIRATWQSGSAGPRIVELTSEAANMSKAGWEVSDA